MSFSFIPAGVPLTSSYAVGALYAVNTSVGGFPVTAALAEYISGYTGPVGPPYIIISSSTIVP